MTSSQFDRVRPRAPHAEPDQTPLSIDTEGKRALFSTEPAMPAVGSVTVECSSCGATSVLSLAQAARALLPSVHLPRLRRHSSFLRCPACHRWQWVRLGVRI